MKLTFFEWLEDRHTWIFHSLVWITFFVGVTIVVCGIVFQPIGTIIVLLLFLGFKVFAAYREFIQERDNTYD